MTASAALTRFVNARKVEGRAKSGLRAAVDVGGTTMKGALFAPDGNVIAHRTLGSFEIAGDALATLVALLSDLISDGDGAPVSAGVATPGLVDGATGEVAYATNLGWRNLSLKAALERALGIPVAIEHDARAAAQAELIAQRAQRGGIDDFLFVPIGTGISAAVIASGKSVAGATGAAGEIGHMVVVPGGDVCGCGQRGCMEAYASASGIARRYRLNGGTAELTSADIVSRLGSDHAAAEVWGEAADALGAGLAAVVAVLDPRLIVLGGGVAGAGAALVEPVRAALGRRLLWRGVPEATTTAIGSSAGLLGAALLVTPGHERATFVTSVLDSPVTK